MNQNSFRLASVAALIASTAVVASIDAAEIRWTFDAGGRVSGQPTLADDRLYVAGGTQVHALDLQGRKIWSRELEGTIAAPIVVEGDELFVHSSAGLHALDREGVERWHHAREDLGPLVDGRTPTLSAN